jgi:hypothetical protein
MCEGGGSTNVGGAPASREEAARIIAANDETSFWRLRGVPGYQLDPVPWARVVRLVAEGTEAAFGQLGRSPAALVVYHRFKLEARPRAAGPAGPMPGAWPCLACLAWGAGRAAHLPPAWGLPEQAGLSGAARAAQVQKEYVGVADYVQVKVFGLATALAPGASQHGLPAAGVSWAPVLAPLQALDLVGEPGRATDHAVCWAQTGASGWWSLPTWTRAKPWSCGAPTCAPMHAGLPAHASQHV